MKSLYPIPLGPYIRPTSIYVYLRTIFRYCEMGWPISFGILMCPLIFNFKIS